MTARAFPSRPGRLRAYLAGPEVFLPNSTEIGARKKRICADAGFEGLFPLDQSLELDGITPPEQAQRIFDADVELMLGSDFAIANCTPFRGPSCDVGTAVEIGFMLAQGKPVFAYSNVSADYLDRVVPDGLMVEDFGLADNLMIEGAVRASGGVFVRRDAAEGMRCTSLDAFMLCVDVARRRLISG